MREIKFRAWVHGFDTVDNGYYTDDVMFDNGDQEWTIGGEYLEREDFTIEQFTGIQDSEGVDIYEGDVVKVLCSDWLSKDDEDPRTIDQYTYGIASTGHVIFTKGSFTIHLGKDRMGYDMHESLIAQRHGFVRVIGNIHQHAHLLEE